MTIQRVGDGAYFVPAYSVSTITEYRGGVTNQGVVVAEDLDIVGRVEDPPSFQVLEPEPMELTPTQEEVTPFSEEELLKLLRPNSVTTPLLADIWRDDVNDELVAS